MPRHGYPALQNQIKKLNYSRAPQTLQRGEERMKTIKRLGTVLIPLMIILLAFSGCRSDDYYDADGSVDISKMLLSMSSKSVKDLGLLEHPDSIEDVSGSIDVAVLGDWISSDGIWLFHQCFTFTSKGDFEMNRAGLPDVIFGGKFTCTVVDGLKVLCCGYYERKGNEYVYYAYEYYAYTIKNGALYLVPLEKTGNGTLYSTRVICLYKYGGDYSFKPKPEAVANNPVSISSLYGEWELDGVTVKIDSDGLKVGDSTFKVHLSNNAKLVVEKDGSSSEYLYYLYYSKTYKDESKTEVTGENFSLTLYYFRDGEDDEPNLMEDIPGWEYDWGLYEITLSRPL